MKNLLAKWNGQFLYEHELYDKVDDIKLEEGKPFRIRLIPERKRKHDSSGLPESNTVHL